MRADDVLVVCGLAVEARIVAGPGIRTLASGGRVAALTAAIQGEVERGVAGIVSFGVAGALSPDTTPGMLIVADAVVADHELIFSDDPWSTRLMRRLPNARAGTIAGSDRIVADRAARAIALRTTGASAVDMESHVVARSALRHALPFVVVRAIADAHDRTLPPAATIAMRADGSTDLGAVMRSIASTPRQLPALLGLARDMGAATRALRHAVRLVGDCIACPDEARTDRIADRR